eukprot:4069940-Lingulodinium_polyedra.AAC.1
MGGGACADRDRAFRRAVELGADSGLAEQAIENWAAVGAWELRGARLQLRPWAAQADIERAVA